LPLTPKYPGVSVGVGVEISTPNKVGVGVGVSFSDTKNSGVGVSVGRAWCRLFPTPTPKQFFLHFERRKYK
jgi:hypothetical protein